MPIPEPEVKPEVEKEKKVKLVKRGTYFDVVQPSSCQKIFSHHYLFSLALSVVKKPKVDPGKEALRALRWAAVEDMIDGLE